MMTKTEFSVGITVWSLEGPDYQPCPELLAICQLINAPKLTRSPAELYPSNNSISAVSICDSDCFLNIDITADPTDQMEVVAIYVRCKKDAADAVDEQLRKIQSRSEIKTALLRGNLGLPTAGIDP